MTIVTIYDNKTTFLIKHYSEVSRREVINEIYIRGVKAETRKSKGRENIAPKTSVLKACLLSLSLPLRRWDLFGYPSVLCQAQLK